MCGKACDYIPPTLLPQRRCCRAAPGALVLDTNVALDWLAFRDPRVAPALDAAVAQRRVRWIASAAMLDEYATVLRRGLAERAGTTADAALAAWQRRRPQLLAAAASQPRWRCRDADDQKFVDLALEHGARWLLTRDRDLLALARSVRPHGLAITPPFGWSAS